MDLFGLISGPLVWLAFIVFLGGSAARVVSFLRLARVKDRPVFTGFQAGWALRSILRWLVPFNITAMESPFVTLAGFAFHLGLVLTGLFASGHAVLWGLGWGLDWWMISDQLSDVLVLAFFGAAGFFALRRAMVPEVRMLTSSGDWAALGLACAPMLTGYLASHGVGNPTFMLGLHIFSGCALLAAIPCTRLSHAFFFFVSRAVTGSDFGKRGVGAW